jgi:hypothetical protein
MANYLINDHPLTLVLLIPIIVTPTNLDKCKHHIKDTY